MGENLILAVALDGAGWHPAAWRDADISRSAVFQSSYWVDQVLLAEEAGIDFVTFEDALSVAAPERAGRLHGRLDAVQIASFVARRTSRIGLVPTTSVLETEPFHASTQLATLDFTSEGRAGWKVQATRPGESANFGRRDSLAFDSEFLSTPAGRAEVARLFDEATEFVTVVRQLWDSWEDDAVIRDVTTGRFLDRDKLHHVRFEGDAFHIAGPSITPRSPQGQPVVTALAHSEIPYRLAARTADVVFVTPNDDADAARIVGSVRAIEEADRFEPTPLRIIADLVVALGPSARTARDRLDAWDAADGEVYQSDAAIIAGTAHELADRIQSLQAAGIEGVRLRPASVHLDLPAIAEQLVPELHRRRALGTAPAAGTLRGRLGLDRPANRYAA